MKNISAILLPREFDVKVFTTVNMLKLATLENHQLLFNLFATTSIIECATADTLFRE